MVKRKINFGTAAVDYYLVGSVAQLKNIVPVETTVLITDENVFAAHSKRFKNWNTIILKPGEEYKIQATIDSTVEQLIGLSVDRKWTLVGIGGGVVTDLTGYVASVYMRGINFGFVPTTLLAMVDASIGGKNGIDVGVYKNMVGSFRQPQFILWDLIFLNSLPDKEWNNGFAEIIKHSCIKDRTMFFDLEKNNALFYKKKKKEACALIERNVMIKTKVVQADPFESGDRKLLNFGHTLGHALENQYELSHGAAIAIGMTYAARISAQLIGLKEPQRVSQLLEKYGLPADATFDKEKVFSVLKMDKKKEAEDIHFVLLEKIGKGIIQKIAINQLKEFIQ